MAFFTGLIFFYGLAWGLSFLFPALFRGDAAKGAIASAVMFILVGATHFLKPGKLLAMIPERWPYRAAMNYASGAFEVLFGLGLLFPATRFYAGAGLILLLWAVFPANIYTAVRKPNRYNISRLFFQPVYMAWIWWFCLQDWGGKMF